MVHSTGVAVRLGALAACGDTRCHGAGGKICMGRPNGQVRGFVVAKAGGRRLLCGLLSLASSCIPLAAAVLSSHPTK